MPISRAQTSANQVVEPEHDAARVGGRALACSRPLPTGGAFYLQEFVPGTPLEVTELEQIDAVIASNARQRGLGVSDMFDHAAQIVAVTAGRHAWFEDVARRSRAGASVAQRGRALAASAGATSLPNDDVVHGDLSASNVIIDRNGAARFIDSETTGRGHRAQDLADLYRQCVVGDLAPAPVLAHLVSGGVIAAGVPQFITCVVSAALNNLAWHATNQPLAEFDRMCSRVQHVLARVHNDCAAATTDKPSR